MKCLCLYYEPGLISHVAPACPEHGQDATMRLEQARESTRRKLLEAGVSEQDVLDLGYVRNHPDRTGW